MTAKYSLKSHHRELKKLIKDLEKFQRMVDKSRFLSDELAQYGITRVMQLTLEAMLTIGEMIIAEENLRVPEKNDDIFFILPEGKVYSKDFAKKLEGLGGFRNILVHDYINLDLNLTYKHLVNGIPVFKKYAKYIAKYILKKEK